MSPLNLAGQSNRYGWANNCQAQDVLTSWQHTTGVSGSINDIYSHITLLKNQYVSLGSSTSNEISQKYREPPAVGMHNSYSNPSSTNSSTLPPTTNSAGMPSSEPIDYPISTIQSYRKTLNRHKGYSAILKAHVLHSFLPSGVMKNVDQGLGKELENFERLKAHLNVSYEGIANDTGSQATAERAKVHAKIEELDLNIKIARLRIMVARNLQPALRCVMETVINNHVIQNRDIAAKKSAERLKKMNNFSGDVPQSKMQGYKMEVPIIFVNGAAGRLRIFGPAYVMTAERQTQTVEFSIDCNFKNTAMNFDVGVIAAKQYLPVLKSHSKDEEYPLDDDYLIDYGYENDYHYEAYKDGIKNNEEKQFNRRKLIEILFHEQAYMQDVLIRSQKITNDLRSYQVYQQKMLQHIYLSEGGCVDDMQPQQQIINDGYNQEEPTRYEPQAQPYDEYMYMQAQAQAQSSMYDEQYPTYGGYEESYAPLPAPPAIPPEVLKIYQAAATVQYQQDYAGAYEEVYPEPRQEISQAKGLTARTRQMQQRICRKRRAPSQRPGARLEFIAAKLRELGHLEKGNK